MLVGNGIYAFRYTSLQWILSWLRLDYAMCLMWKNGRCMLDDGTRIEVFDSEKFVII